MAKFIVGEKTQLSKQIARQIIDIVKQNPKAILCLPTGNSPLEVYKEIVNIYKKEKISFKDVTTYNLDEYLGIDVNKDPISFKNFMKTNLFNHIDLVHYNFPDTEANYNKKLDSFDKFDYTLLGVGTNGHIAFNEPGTSEDRRTNTVTLTKETIQANFKGMSKYPTTAITMGLKDIIWKSKKISIMAWGDSKYEALLKVKEGKKDNKWPITLLSKLNNVNIYTDLKMNKSTWKKIITFKWFSK